MRVIIVGAGMTGLTCARELQSRGHTVVVVDKGRAVGGRMATRTIDGARFDHGAQHFSVRSPAFAELIAPLEATGTVREWFASESVTEPDRGTEPRMVGRSGMRRIPEAMAADLDVRTAVSIERLRFDEGTVVAETADSAIDGSFDAAVVTAPVPQMRQLLDSSKVNVPTEIDETLRSLSYDPCLALMGLPRGSADLVEGHATGDGAAAWIADNQHKQTSDAPAITVHGSPDFSRRYLEADPAEWSALLAADAERMIGCRLDVLRTHRWRYSIPVASLDVGCLRLQHSGVAIALAGEIFSGARVESAFTSGHRAAAALTGFDPAV